MVRYFFYFMLILVLVLLLFNYSEQRSFQQFVKRARNNGMRIPVNTAAPVIAKQEVEIAASIDTVWNVLTDIQHWPKWQQAITSVQLDGSVIEGKSFTWKAGGISFTSQVHTMQPRHLFGWTGKTVGAMAIHNWTFAQQNGKTIVYVEESLQGVLPKLFRGYFQKNLDTGMAKNLQELKAYAEGHH